VLEIIDRLRQLEEDKREAEIGTPEFVAMATEAEGLSRDVFRWSQLQDDLAKASTRRRDGGGFSGRSIEDTPVRPLQQILADWREAEVRLQRLVPGSPEATSATREIERLREQYQAIHDTKVDREEP
jgi:hypothetical protein